MIHSRPPALALLALPLVLVACGEPPTSTNKAAETMADTPATIAPDSPAAPTAPASRDTGPIAVPERFRGVWDASAAACAGRSGEMRLVVEPDRLRFHESVADLLALRGTDDEISLDLGFEGEGETWRETRTLRLEPDGRLKVATAGDSATRVRCAF